MNYTTNLFWVFVLMHLFFFFCVLILALLDILTNKGIKYLKKESSLLEFFSIFAFVLIAYVAQMVFNFQNLLIFYILYAFLIFIGGLVFDYVWLKLMGKRLFTFHKEDILGFTSWYLLPFWGTFGLLFYGLWQSAGFTTVQFDPYEFVKTFLAWGVVGGVLCLSLKIVFDYINNKISRDRFSWRNYSIFLMFIIFGLLGVALELNLTQIIPYFIVCAVVGVFAEGILNYVVKKIYGYTIWEYDDFTLFGRGSSLLMLPLWGMAGVLSILVFMAFK